MTETKKNISYFPLYISTSFAVFSLFLFCLFSFEHRDVLKETSNTQTSELNLFIEKFQSHISQLDGIQQSIGTASTAKLIESLQFDLK